MKIIAAALIIIGILGLIATAIFPILGLFGLVAGVVGIAASVGFAKLCCR